MSKKKLFLITFLVVVGLSFCARSLDYYGGATISQKCDYIVCPGAGFPFAIRPYNDETGQYKLDYTIILINLIALAVVAYAITALIRYNLRLRKKGKK